MIRPVDTSLIDAVTQPAADAGASADTSAATTSDAKTFSTVLKREADKTTTDAATTTVADRAVPPDGEKWRPVKGHDDYAEIIAGDRKGQFVNLNRGSRKGEAFTIEQRDGKTVHVYGTGDSAISVEVSDSKEAKAAGTPKTAPSKNETWAPVAGHTSYADILSGSRNGYFVNIQQGSSREGEAFHIVKSGGKEFHVYGSGQDKVSVEVGAKKKTSAAADSTA
ncbi:MAG: hypothetical protein QOJ07_3967, partial [Thermoleophilaceae bacterium]|nr:hypothetical protein [Thermoleophilaceae bacterium]